jgi:alpha-methylacyl-CoA racemase
MLADMGAEVVTLDRIGATRNLNGIVARSRKWVQVDPKDDGARSEVVEAAANAQAL